MTKCIDGVLGLCHHCPLYKVEERDCINCRFMMLNYLLCLKCEPPNLEYFEPKEDKSDNN